MLNYQYLWNAFNYNLRAYILLSTCWWDIRENRVRRYLGLANKQQLSSQSENDRVMLEDSSIDAEDLMWNFIQDKGWEKLKGNDSKSALEPERQKSVYQIYDEKLLEENKGNREAKEDKSDKLYYKFSEDGNCETLRGNHWSVLVHELNELLTHDIQPIK